MTIGEWTQTARERLAGAGIESAALEAQLLAAHVLLVDRTYILTHPNEPFPELAGENLLQRRESREPLAHILGYREFYGRRFRVNREVLIPRQETEILVETALRHLPQSGSALDLGVGSGSIAVTLKLERPDAAITAVDNSADALDVARDNAETLGADIRIMESDGFAELLGESFDLIVTNPPYIGNGEELQPEVRDHEPAQALFSGPTGLEFYERLCDEAADYLKDGGKLLMEVGYTQARTVASLFESQGWSLIEIVPDLSGIDRVVVVQPVFACATG